MAHSGDGTGWDELAPANTDPRKDGAQEIRDLRIGLSDRLEREVTTMSSSSAGGWARQGSAKAYSVADYTEPTARPDDDTTALDSDDEGRLAVMANRLFYYNSTPAWTPVRSQVDEGTIDVGEDPTWSAWSTDIDYAFRVIIVSGSAATHSGLKVVSRSADNTYDLEFADGTTLEIQSDQSGNHRFRVRSADSDLYGTTLNYYLLP